MINVLVVEDELKLAHFVQLELQYEGYKVQVANDGLTGLTVARESQFDLIILDWMLPGISGIEICRRLRSTGNKTPIILLTAKDDIQDRVTGLDAGADDYVLKPFSVEELLARVRAHLRRNSEESTEILKFADLVLNKSTREVYRGDKLIELTVKEYDLLVYLMSHPKQVLIKEKILTEVWGYDFIGDTNIVEVYIRYLRLKLESDHQSRLIQTVRGVGYVLREK
ncbi:MAG TPA: response regulator transcription factor [Allocoleopsis sp.]